MEYQPVVLAAGKGSRLPEFTSHIPKALLPIANRPMIWYPLHMLEKKGFDHVFIVVLKSQASTIQGTLNAYKLTNMKLSYIEIKDEDEWGTADSLRYIADKFVTDIIVMSCDLITNFDLERCFNMFRIEEPSFLMVIAPPYNFTYSPPGSKNRKKTEPDTMAITKPEMLKICKFKPMSDILEESPVYKENFNKLYTSYDLFTGLVDGHLYLFKKYVLDILRKEPNISSIKYDLIPYLIDKQYNHDLYLLKNPPKPIYENFTEDTDMSEINLKDLANELSHAFKGYLPQYMPGGNHRVSCIVYRYPGNVLRANDILSYVEANRLLAADLSQYVSKHSCKPVHPSVNIVSKKNTQIGATSFIGEGSTVKENVTIKQSVIGKHCVIGEKSKISNSIIMDHVTLKDGCTVNDSVIASNNLLEGCILNKCLVGKASTVTGTMTDEVILTDDQWMVFDDI